MPRGRKASAKQSAVKAKGRGRVRGSTNIESHAMSMLKKEMQSLKTALQDASKKVRAAKKEAIQRGTKAAHRVVGLASKEKAKVEATLEELNRKFHSLRVNERIQALQAQVLKAEALIEEKLKEFQKQLTEKTTQDFEKALSAFNNRWHKRRSKLNVKKTQSQRRKLASKASATAKKVSRQIKQLEKKALGKKAPKKTTVRQPRAAKKPAATTAPARKPAKPRGRRPSKA